MGIAYISITITYILLKIIKCAKFTPQISLISSFGVTMSFMYSIIKFLLIYSLFKLTVTSLGLIIFSGLTIFLAAKLLKY